MTMRTLCLTFLLTISVNLAMGQQIKWTSNSSFYETVNNLVGNEIVEVTLPNFNAKKVVTAAQLTPKGATKPLSIRKYALSKDRNLVLIYTNSQRVWRYDTRGDYWVLNLKTNALRQIGQQFPSSSLMFAKISPDNERVAYVCQRNIYVESLADGKVTPLTKSTDPKVINGTFDWVYEEEFDCRDGFRWSPDGQNIAYWQIDASKIKHFTMISTTDSIYPRLIPVEYPKVGEMPSPYKIGVVNAKTAKTTWIDFQKAENTYAPRMEWADNSTQLVIQQLNRAQNHSKLLYADIKTGKLTQFYEERDAAWIDLKQDGVNETGYIDWSNDSKSFYWTSEKSGWRHVYRVSRDGKSETCLTCDPKKEFDVISVKRIDETNGWLYFMASPDNATQSYLYRVSLQKTSPPSMELLSPAEMVGSHTYNIAPDGRFAYHGFQNYYMPEQNEWTSLTKSITLNPKFAQPIVLEKGLKEQSNIEFFKVTTADGVTMDGWIQRPTNAFNPKKKYPVLFHVYSEPAAANVADDANVGGNGLYAGSLADDGYIYVCIDGRGTPLPRGRAWRKAIHRNIGAVNIRDQAMGALEVFKKYPFIDTSRVAVWGWSGGGSTTLNLLFQYPDIYKTGIAVAAVANQLTYDNIYQERYMGVPTETYADYVKGSPITHAKNLRGNLLYIHGTGDDNVHYQNAEMLLNELIKHNKQFQFMAYPNRSHGIFEGEGTGTHLSTLFTKFLNEKCPSGGR